MSSSTLTDEMGDDPVSAVFNSNTSIQTPVQCSKLPWDICNEHFKTVKLIKDEIIFQTFEVKCIYCPSTKTRTTDTRSKSFKGILYLYLSNKLILLNILCSLRIIQY